MSTWHYGPDGLEGPAPIPPVLSIHGAELGASALDTWAEVDQERRCVTTWHEPLENSSWLELEESTFYLRGWLGAGWYAQYRRAPGSRRFVLASVSADRWALRALRA
jgi:hypothetical protein